MISDAQPPPVKLKIILHGEAKKKVSGYSGTYTLQSSPVNGNPWWKKGVFDEEAIWSGEESGCWWIGRFKDLGKALGFIHGPFGVDEWPNDIASGWKYHSKGWHEAGNDILIEGKQVILICFNFKPSSNLFAGYESFTKKIMGVFKSKK